MAEPAATRGHLSIADRVVSNVARLAAQEVPGTVTVPRARAGFSRGLPRAAARVAASRVYLTVDVAVVWPSPLGAVTAAVAEMVAGRVEELTGLVVDGIDVTAETMIYSDELEAPRRVR